MKKTRHYIIPLIAGLGSLALVACAPKDDTPAPTTSAGEALDRTVDATGNAMDRAAQSAGNAANQAGNMIETSWDNIKDATYDERASFQASLTNLSTSVDQKINELQARSATATAATKEKLEDGIEELREARADLQEEIAGLSDATAATWSDAKAEVATAWQRVKAAYSKVES